MSRNYIAIFALGIAILSAGCTIKKADLAVVGTKGLNLSMMGFDKVGENITGESTSYAILLIPFKHMSIEEAINNALQKAGGDVMTDTALYYKVWVIPPFYGRTSIEVTGTVWKQNKNPQ